MPVPAGGDDQIGCLEDLDVAVDNLDQAVRLRHTESSARQEVVLQVNDDQGISRRGLDVLDSVHVPVHVHEYAPSTGPFIDPVVPPGAARAPDPAFGSAIPSQVSRTLRAGASIAACAGGGAGACATSRKGC